MARKPAALPPLDRFLTYRLHLVNKLTDKFSSDAYADEFGLPVGEARCLAAIGNFAPLSVVELAARANLNKGQASRAAQALAERGLVLAPTAAGRALWNRVMALIARRNDEIFGCLSAAERRQLGGMLDRLITHARR